MEASNTGRRWAVKQSLVLPLSEQCYGTVILHKQRLYAMQVRVSLSLCIPAMCFNLPKFWLCMRYICMLRILDLCIGHKTAVKSHVVRQTLHLPHLPQTLPHVTAHRHCFTGERTHELKFQVFLWILSALPRRQPLCFLHLWLSLWDCPTVSALTPLCHCGCWCWGAAAFRRVT